MASISSCLSKLLKLPTTREFDETTSHLVERNVKTHVLAGPNLCGKTSLLFEYAFSCAEKGDNVLYVAPKELNRLPLFVNERTQPMSDVLKRINMVYLSSYKELLAYFSNAHMDKARNSSRGQSKHVLIDDFDWYFQEKGTRNEETTRLAKCMAYVIDAIDFWSKNMQGHSDGKMKISCCLWLAETLSGDSIGIEKLGLYKHWVTDFIKIQKIGNDCFRIQPVEHAEYTNSLSSRLTFHYNIEDNAIRVKQDKIKD